MKQKAYMFLGLGLIMLLSLLWVLGITSTPRPETPPGEAASSSPKDISFVLQDRTVVLWGGRAEYEVAPGSAGKETFQVFGEPVWGDADGDGDQDAALYLTQESGGSGTFFYVVLAIRDQAIWRGTNAMFIGDRIAPQNINFDGKHFVANFAERHPEEPMSTPPSLGKSVWVHLDPNTGEIGELAKDGPEEADPSRMTLSMKTWEWVRTESSGTTILPRTKGKFTLLFGNDGQVVVGTDCNGMGGSYTTEGGKISFGPMMSTLMYCEGAQEGDFSAMLRDVHSYAFTGKGELQLFFQENGIMVFH